MGKKDKEGNLITGSKSLKLLYIQTYTDRLKHRNIKAEFKEIYELKTVLWDERMKVISDNKSQDWTFCDIDKVTKSLKNNQTRDPIGMISELLKPDVMGKDLKKAILFLMNGVKKNLILPDFLQYANIASIYKNKGSRFDLENDRGIFILTVFRKVFDKLIYQDKYAEIEMQKLKAKCLTQTLGPGGVKILKITCLSFMEL